MKIISDKELNDSSWTNTVALSGSTFGKWRTREIMDFAQQFKKDIKNKFHRSEK